MTDLRGTTRGEPDMGFDAKAVEWRAKRKGGGDRRKVSLEAA